MTASCPGAPEYLGVLWDVLVSSLDLGGICQCLNLTNEAVEEDSTALMCPGWVSYNRALVSVQARLCQDLWFQAQCVEWYGTAWHNTTWAVSDLESNSFLARGRVAASDSSAGLLESSSGTSLVTVAGERDMEILDLVLKGLCPE